MDLNVPFEDLPRLPKGSIILPQGENLNVHFSGKVSLKATNLPLKVQVAPKKPEVAELATQMIQEYLKDS
jgi:hypothetical protein